MIITWTYGDIDQTTWASSVWNWVAIVPVTKLFCAVAGEVFVAGAAKGEVFVPSAEEAEVSCH